MKGQGRHSNQQLLRMLGETLRKECSRWSSRSYPPPSKAASQEVVGGPQRDALVKYLADLNEKLDFYPETFFLSVSILDQFLSIVKAKPRHVPLIGVTALYLAAKIKEEDEVIPGTLEFVRVSAVGCSQAEVLRMERCMLGKLSWDLLFATPLDFLHIFHALLFINVPHLLDNCGHMTAARQLSLVSAKLEHCVVNRLSLQHAPSTLALALLSLELELFSQNWLSITYTLQKMVQIDNDELISCRETCASILQSMGRSSNRYVYASKSPSPASKSTPTKRRRVVEQEDDEDDIYDGIKQLYEEANHSTSCATQARSLEEPNALRAVVI
eukprot:GHVO01043321.1.p1 GENE.GHVO01043321.1~~GHVO01043321.1.p1  ORF type:complete len:328 (-),score=33.38 GHVO01043321.1:395-1378(-)